MRATPIAQEGLAPRRNRSESGGTGRRRSEEALDFAGGVEAEAVGGGDAGEAGHGRHVAADGDEELGPDERRTSRTGMEWREGAPFALGSVEKLYCVFAMQTG